MEIKEIIEIVTRVCREKKAEDIVTLDMRGLSSIADVFFLCSAENTRQVKAISEAIEEQLKKAGRGPTRIEGFPEARWVVMDYGDILLHIFLDETRSYYSLETLWGDAPHLIFSAKK